jgi:toxin FitB
LNRYLLDTNIFGNFTLPEPSPFLRAWLETQTEISLFTTSITLGEIRRGILIMPYGRKRTALETWFYGNEGPEQMLEGRILPFDQKAAFVWAEMMAAGRKEGRTRTAFDTMIAAIAKANDCIVVTDNTKDFSDVETINPVRFKLT